MVAALARLAGDVPVLGPIGVAVSGLTTVASQVIGADPVRRAILFHNPGNAVKRVLPVGNTLAGGSGGIMIYPQNDYFLLDQDSDEFFNINCAWQAVTDNNNDGALTIFNFTDANLAVTAPEMVARINHLIPITSPNAPIVPGLNITSQQVIGANPNRRGIVFHNPSSVLLAVCPANLTASIGPGSWIVLPGKERRILAKGQVRVNCAWNGIAQSGVSNSLTILEFL